MSTNKDQNLYQSPDLFPFWPILQTTSTAAAPSGSHRNWSLAFQKTNPTTLPISLYLLHFLLVFQLPVGDPLIPWSMGRHCHQQTSHFEVCGSDPATALGTRSQVWRWNTLLKRKRWARRNRSPQRFQIYVGVCVFFLLLIKHIKTSKPFVCPTFWHETKGLNSWFLSQTSGGLPLIRGFPGFPAFDPFWKVCRAEWREWQTSTGAGKNQ